MLGQPPLLGSGRIRWVRAVARGSRWWRLARGPALAVVCAVAAFLAGFEIGPRMAPVSVVLETHAEAGGSDVRMEVAIPGPGTALAAGNVPEEGAAPMTGAQVPSGGEAPGEPCHAQVAPAPDPPPPLAPGIPEPPSTPGRVDINRASAVELELVPGIGSVLAGRIVEFRDRYGPFAEVEDLLEVRGIGPKVLERLRDYVTVSQ